MSSVSADQLGLTPELDLAELSALIAPAFLRENGILPLSLNAELLAVAMAPPLDAELVEALEMAAERPVAVIERDAKAVQSGLDSLFSGGKSVLEQIVDGMAFDSQDEDVDRLMDLASEAPVVRLVSHLI